MTRPPSPRRDWHVRQAWAAGALTLGAVAFHVTFFALAGPLWRDEVTSVVLATRPHVRDVLANLRHDSFPVLWPLGLRLWAGLGLGRTDLSLRGLGLLAGLGVVAALWHNARRLGAATPIVSLALLQFTTTTVCYGDSIRGYGWGTLLGLVAIGAVWQLARSATPLRVAAAAVASLLAVHLLFYNCVLLLAACCGGAAVCLVNGRRRRAAVVLGIGGGCGVTMLAYLPVIRGRAEIAFMFQYPLTIARMAHKLHEAVTFMPQGTSTPVPADLVWLVAIAAALAVGAAAWRAARTPGRSPPPQRDAVVFSAVTLVVGIPAYLAFLAALRYLMQPWYFLAGLAMVATCLDGLFAAVPRAGLRAAVTVAACLFAAANWAACWRTARVCMTNVDLVAARLNAAAAPGDLIVVDPWWVGVSFNRYYHGRAPWTTVPPVAEIDFQRYDLLLAATRDARAVDPVLARLAATLGAGHQVWFVCIAGFDPFDLGTAPAVPPVPRPPPGSHEVPYYRFWNDQVLRQLLADHAALRGPAVLGNGQDVNLFEVALWYKAARDRGGGPAH